MLENAANRKFFEIKAPARVARLIAHLSLPGFVRRRQSLTVSFHMRCAKGDISFNAPA
jgi:hypothetical protein